MTWHEEGKMGAQMLPIEHAENLLSYVFATGLIRKDAFASHLLFVRRKKRPVGSLHTLKW
jgi:hypothetical protein